MGLSQEQLAKIISMQSKGLCSANADKIIEAKQKGYNVNEIDFDKMPKQKTKEEDYDPWGFGDYGTSVNQNQSKSYSQIDDEDDREAEAKEEAFYAQRSKMPKEIKESLQNNPINLDPLKKQIDPLGGLGTEKRVLSNNRQINEQVNHGIDYSIIKAIVNECLNEHLSKTILNENSGSLVSIGLANGKIKLVDNKGNIFEAKLSKVGNVNEKREQ